MMGRVRFWVVSWVLELRAVTLLLSLVLLLLERKAMLMFVLYFVVANSACGGFVSGVSRKEV